MVTTATAKTTGSNNTSSTVGAMPSVGKTTLVGAAPTGAPPAVQMQQPTNQGGQGWQTVLMAISHVDPATGAHDYRGGLRVLEPLSMADMLRALQDVARAGELDPFFTAVGGAASPRARTAFRAVQLARNARSADPTVVDAINQTLPALPATEQAEVVAHIAQHAGSTGNEILAEGVVSALQTASAPMATAAAGASSPVGPGPWSPPGNQPAPFYIGNEAHLGIALRYLTLHAGQQVFTNSIPFSSILNQISGAHPSAVAATNLALRPDIANITLGHLYEIKPLAQAAEAEAKLDLYLAIFRTAGVPMAPGGQLELGTAGVLPAPGGYYMYECPVPGVILYQYRRGQYVPQLLPQEQPEQAPQTDRRGFWDHMRDITGLTGTALVIYVIISEGSRAFPPRNLVPVP